MAFDDRFIPEKQIIIDRESADLLTMDQYDAGIIIAWAKKIAHDESYSDWRLALPEARSMYFDEDK